jgi:hypothetical protein
MKRNLESRVFAEVPCVRVRAAIAACSSVPIDSSQNRQRSSQRRKCVYAVFSTLRLLKSLEAQRHRNTCSPRSVIKLEPCTSASVTVIRVLNFKTRALTVCWFQMTVTPKPRLERRHNSQGLCQLSDAVQHTNHTSRRLKRSVLNTGQSSRAPHPKSEMPTASSLELLPPIPVSF